MRRLGTMAVIAMLVPLALASGCASPGAPGEKKKSFTDRVHDTIRSQFSSTYHDTEAEGKLSRGEELFASGKYEESQKLFADIADNNYNSSTVMEKARFMEAESVRMQGKLPRAVDTYNRLLKDYPGSIYTENAALRMYSIAEAWVKDSVKDIEEREAGKSYWARLRAPNFSDKSKPKIDQEGEVLKTFENVATHAPQSTVADKAMFWCGYIHYSRGNYSDADHFFSTLATGYKDSPLRREAAEYAVRAKNKASGGAVYDGQKTMEALQLVNNLEATDPEYVQNKDKSVWIQKQKMSIRMNQAEKDYETAEYYRRTKNLPSAYFYYHLVKMRYPGTKFSDLAIGHIAELEKLKPQWDAEQAKKVNAKPKDPTLNDTKTGPKDVAPRVGIPDGTR